MSEKRRFPVEEKFMNKKVSDMLYGYLQSISTTKPNEETDDDKSMTRIVYKTDYSHTNVQNHFGVDENGKYVFQRLAVTRAMRVLIQFGYVRERKIRGKKGNFVEVYELPYNEQNTFQYIPLETLRFLLNTCNPNVIKLYIYFLNSYNNFGDEFEFTNKRLLKDCFGLVSNSNKKANDELKDRLQMLKDLNLVGWCEYVKVYKNKRIPTKRLLYVNKHISHKE